MVVQRWSSRFRAEAARVLEQVGLTAEAGGLKPGVGPVSGIRVRSRGVVSYPGPGGTRVHLFYLEPAKRVSFEDAEGVRHLYLNAALPLDGQGWLRVAPAALVCPDCGFATSGGGRCVDCMTEALDARARSVGQRLPGCHSLQPFAPEEEEEATRVVMRDARGRFMSAHPIGSDWAPEGDGVLRGAEPSRRG